MNAAERLPAQKPVRWRPFVPGNSQLTSPLAPFRAILFISGVALFLWVNESGNCCVVYWAGMIFTTGARRAGSFKSVCGVVTAHRAGSSTKGWRNKMMRQIFKKMMGLFGKSNASPTGRNSSYVVERENDEVLLRGLRAPARRVSNRSVGKRGRMRLYRSYPSNPVVM